MFDYNEKLDEMRKEADAEAEALAKKSKEMIQNDPIRLAMEDKIRAIREAWMKK